MPVFAIAIFGGSFLLFQVQPLLGKYLLPWFGGGPGVWTTCMLFFQFVLLAGYSYAHFSTRWLRPRAQAAVHLGLLILALALLPVIPGRNWEPRGDESPVGAIVLLLARSAGLPFFVLAAGAPLLQRWFSRAHPGRSPYRLYALSNAGSLLALISYPFFFEPRFSRRTQALCWGWGLLAYTLCAAVCAFRMCRAAGSRASAPIADAGAPAVAASGARIPGHVRALWLLLPACASVLLLACTNKLCLDTAVIPFLWILPLAVYLLSFIICFDHPRWYRRYPFALALIAALAGMCWAIQRFDRPPVQLIAVYCAGLFVCCMVCHGELFRLRPEAERLTSFYLFIAAGGALGGVFVAVIAPAIFSGYLELQAGMVLCPALFLTACLADRKGAVPGQWRWLTTTLPFAGLAGLVLLGAGLWFQREKFGDRLVYHGRNFFGVLKVFDHAQGDPPEHILWVSHGRTLHGAEFVGASRARWPTLYYGARSGVGFALRALPDHGGRRLGLVGLGSGTLATYARPSDQVSIYELDPQMEYLARAHFGYLSNCPAPVTVTLGDARLSLEREPAHGFDLLALDAFSSDAIPVHLLTVEAFAVYLRHLGPNGVIAVHISNRWLDLEPVVANLARHYGLEIEVIEFEPAEEQWWLRHSVWALLARNESVLAAPEIRSAARPPNTRPAVGLWTDDFSSLFEILR